jgi:hypothetical protein
MARGVAARGAIATADVTAAQAEAQVDPAHAGFQALFTPRCAGGHRVEAPSMLTNHHAPPESHSRGRCCN